MTLEHIPDTGEFIGMVNRSLTDSPNACVFFQVPDVMRILDEQAFWDIYYEHCSYFSIGSLARLFRRASFTVLNLGREYTNQYVTIEAQARSDASEFSCPGEDDLASLKTLVHSFAAKVPGQIAEWRRRLECDRAQNLKTVVWGAGSKGVSFLSTVDVPGAVEYVVDINPHMHSHYLAKTGLEIVAPAALVDYHRDVVIVMNPVYRPEIVAQLNSLGLRPEVVST